MKIAIVRTTPDSASSPVSSPGQGHRVTVDAQKRQPDVPDRAELGGGLRVVHIPVGAVGKRGDAELLARVPAFSDPLRARWRRERPDAVHAVSWASGLPALMAGPRQRGPGHTAASEAPAGAGHRPTPTVFAGAVTKTARLLASKGPQSTYVRNS